MRRWLGCLVLLYPLTGAAGLFDKNKELLPEEQAFRVVAEAKSAALYKVSWVIAPDYYMYRDKFEVVPVTAGVTLGPPEFPEGVIEQDEIFGEVEVYFYQVDINVPVTAAPAGLERVELLLHGQGCNKPVGVCYPPMKRPYTLEVGQLADAATGVAATTPTAPPGGESFWGFLLTAFWAGVLLTFTPCVLPMIPILSGVIARQGQPGRRRAGTLSIAYVLGTAVTYTATGVVAGATGAQLQAYFQHPWVIAALCLVLVALALALFGVWRVELPETLRNWAQSRADRLQARTAGWGGLGLYGGVFALGLVSALVVGACVSPLLITALGAAIRRGDPVLGGAMLFAMAMGMGVLLIAFGFGAGWLLPRAGAWMQRISQLFGFMVLGVAIYLFDNTGWVPGIFLWAAWLASLGFFIFFVAGESAGKPVWQALLRGVAAMLLVWGGAAAVGAMSGARDVLAPLSELTTNRAATNSTQLEFVDVQTNPQLDAVLADARRAGRPVMIDFYADWCVDCIRMLRTTFMDAAVQAELSQWILIKVDVTDPGGPAEAVKTRFGVFGPPATLYVDAGGREIESMRRYGFMSPDELLRHIGQLSVTGKMS